MAFFKSKFDSARQDWPTPDDLFSQINNEFGFTLDVAASAENAKCTNFIDKDADAMVVDWGRNVCWLNPPYGASGKYTLKRWVERAQEQANKGATVVMLIPARTNTEWFHTICLAKCEVRFLRGRPKFGNATHGLPQPLCLIIMRPPMIDPARALLEKEKTK